MIIKLTGALLILIGCGGVGYLLSFLHKKTSQAMLHLIAALEHMEYLLQYRQSSLQDMFRCLNINNGPIKQFFHILAAELEHQVSPNVECCITVALEKAVNVPNPVKDSILKLGHSLGQFDLEEQVKCLQSLRKECEIYLQQHLKDHDVRLRTYQTLVLCAGAVIVIILL